MIVFTQRLTSILKTYNILNFSMMVTKASLHHKVQPCEDYNVVRKQTGSVHELQDDNDTESHG